MAKLKGQTEISYTHPNGLEYYFSCETRDSRAEAMIELLKLGLNYKGICRLTGLAPNTCRHEVRLYHQRKGTGSHRISRNTGPSVEVGWRLPAELHLMLSRYASRKGVPLYVAGIALLQEGLKDPKPSPVKLGA